MPCYPIKPRPMTLGEAKEIVGGPEALRAKGHDHWAPKVRAEAARVQADWDIAHKQMMPDIGPVWMCGEDLAIVMCHEGCGYEGDLLCDWPMGRGKTCDLPLCVAHARNIGVERDLCLVHWALWTKQGGGRVNTWPPVRK